MPLRLREIQQIEPAQIRARRAHHQRRGERWSRQWPDPANGSRDMIDSLLARARHPQFTRLRARNAHGIAL